MTTLGDEFPKEQKRLRDLLACYKLIGPYGNFGAGMIAHVLERADEAVAKGDTVAMIGILVEMKGHK